MDYFFVELRLEAHLEALRHFLLMEDGEFAQSLSDLLFEKVALGPGQGDGLPWVGWPAQDRALLLSPAAGCRPDARGAADATSAQLTAEQSAAVQPAWSQSAGPQPFLCSQVPA